MNASPPATAADPIIGPSASKLQAIVPIGSYSGPGTWPVWNESRCAVTHSSGPGFELIVLEGSGRGGRTSIRLNPHHPKKIVNRNRVAIECDLFLLLSVAQ